MDIVDFVPELVELFLKRPKEQVQRGCVLLFECLPLFTDSLTGQILKFLFDLLACLFQQ